MLDIDLLLQKKTLQQIRGIAATRPVCSVPGLTFMAALSDADGNVLAGLEGENCYGPGKLRMIESWLADEGLKRDQIEVRFYSDHVSDAPVMDWADEPFAVNAHGPLRQLAKLRGWPVLDREG